MLRSIFSHPLLDNSCIEAASWRLQGHIQKDAGSLREARMHTRNLMRIMNCIQCNKCRFHCKILMMGLSTALQLAVCQGDTGGM
jgi:hypothetical protein